MHCRRFLDAPLTRRQMLRQCANGFGAMALATLLSDRTYGAAPAEKDPLQPRPAQGHGAGVREALATPPSLPSVLAGL